MDKDKLQQEADHFSQQDNQAQRMSAWTAVPGIADRIRTTLDVDAIVVESLASFDNKRGLTLACGDMTGPYGLFKQSGVQHVDAYDLSEGQRKKFFDSKYDGDITVDYRIADVNTLELPANHYDLVVVQQAFHHFEALEFVAQQIWQSLKPHGLFVLKDYIGANFLQRTPDQRAVCSMLWRTLPERLRRHVSGKVMNGIYIPDKNTLPPYEGIRAEEVLPVIQRRFRMLHGHCYAGILFPLWNGFAQNYTQSTEDMALIGRLWQLDRQMIDSGAVEPNFIRAIFAR
ncbi:MAG: class I SAM-dependent methyltransferase [Gammaproteobacteria bacterium]|nr:MAG: class I SAM-dependent methyltransferase [Gammaproteobacteria bacterium]